MYFSSYLWNFPRINVITLRLIMRNAILQVRINLVNRHGIRRKEGNHMMIKDLNSHANRSERKSERERDRDRETGRERGERGREMRMTEGEGWGGRERGRE